MVEIANFVSTLVDSKGWPVGTDTADEEKDMEPVDSEQLHSLVLELANVSPMLIQRVLPVLERRMLAGNGTVRLETAELLGAILLSDAASSLQDKHVLYDLLTSRMDDSDSRIRLQIVKFCDNHFSQSPPQEAHYTMIGDRLMDADAAVRAAAVSTVSRLAKAHPQEVPDAILESLLTRLSDTHFPVRQEAILSLCELYMEYCKMGASLQRRLSPQYSEIASKVLESYKCTGTQKEIYNYRLQVEQALTGTLLPQTQGARAQEMTQLYRSLQPAARAQYKVLLQQKVKYGQHLMAFVVERSSGKKAGAAKVLNELSALIPDAVASKKQLLEYLNQVKDKRALRLLKTMCEPADTIEEACANKRKVLQQSVVAQSSEVVQGFLGRAAATALTLTDMRELWDIWQAKTQGQVMATAAEELFVAISEVSPQLCQGLVPEVVEILEENNSQLRSALTIAGNCGTPEEPSLQGAALGKLLLQLCASEETKHSVSTLAARVILQARSDRIKLFEEFISTYQSVEDFASAGDALPSILSTLAEVAGTQSTRHVIVPAWPAIQSFITDKVLNEHPSRTCAQPALNLITEYVSTTPAGENIQDLATSLIELLTPLLRQKTKWVWYPALKTILHIVKRPGVAELVSPELFHLLASSFEKECVGSQLVIKKELFMMVAKGLHPQFSVFLALSTSFEDDVKAKAKSQLESICARLIVAIQRSQPALTEDDGSTLVTGQHPEAQLPYLIHYLAHRPGFPEGKDDPAWEEFSAPLLAYLGALLSNRMGNIAYINGVLKAILRTSDGVKPESNRIHHITYLAIRLLQKQRGQTFPVYSHKIQLPYSYYDPEATPNTVRQHFEMPTGMGVVPRSPGVKHTPTKNSPAKRKAPDKCAPALFGTPTLGEKAAGKKREVKRKPKQREVTPCATKEQRESTAAELHRAAGMSHPSVELKSRKKSRKAVAEEEDNEDDDDEEEDLESAEEQQPAAAPAGGQSKWTRPCVECGQQIGHKSNHCKYCGAEVHHEGAAAKGKKHQKRQSRGSSGKLSTRTDVNVQPSTKKQKPNLKESEVTSNAKGKKKSKATPRRRSRQTSAAVSPFDFPDDE